MANGEPQAPPWSLRPGDTIKRTELHTRFGGRRQGGIGPSRVSPNVFLFTAPEGRLHGYGNDGWEHGDVFRYTGEGQRGDQLMVGGNKAVRDHRQDGRALRVFDGASGTVEYMGEFTLDPENPYFMTDAPETGHGPLRSVIVFRLRRLDGAPPPGEDLLDRTFETPGTVPVPVEQQWTEKAFVDPKRDPYEAERREQPLVLKLQAHLEGRSGKTVCRLRIIPPGEVSPLFTDLYDEHTRTLFEAKGSVARSAIRMAIGQLADYRRFIEGGVRHSAVVVPSRPRPDLLALLAAERVQAVWIEDGRWVDTADGELVGEMAPLLPH